MPPEVPVILVRWEETLGHFLDRTEKFHIERVDAGLDRLRVLLRLSHARRYLDEKAYQSLSRETDQVGRMLGGWRADAESRGSASGGR